MSAPAIKICGISTSAALDAALKARADYVGLVFFAKSPRNVSITQATALARQAGAAARVVGLFVDPADDFLDAVRAAVPLDVIQLHGNERPEQAARWRRHSGLEVWKAIGVRQRADLDAARAYAGAADRVLFDAKPPRDAAWPGGHGLPFDWRLLQSLSLEKPWLLAGGLRTTNLQAAVALTRAPIVDVSSGVESRPGIKDPEKLEAFFAAARRIDAAAVDA